jgi:hypothetical protein
MAPGSSDVHAGAANSAWRCGRLAGAGATRGADQRTHSCHAQETHGVAQGPRDADLSRHACTARYGGGSSWRAGDVARVGAFPGAKTFRTSPV